MTDGGTADSFDSFLENKALFERSVLNKLTLFYTNGLSPLSRFVNSVCKFPSGLMVGEVSKFCSPSVLERPLHRTKYRATSSC